MRHPSDTIQTARLALRRFTPRDLEPLVQLYSDPEVTRYIGGLKAREQVEELLRDRILAYYDQHPGLGIWATLERQGGAFVGLHLLNHIHGESDIQVGYVLHRDHWGRGYATEMCVALLRYGFADLKLPRIAAITDRPNLASQRVLLKAGLHRNGERTLAHPQYASVNPLCWFERDAADWLAEHPHSVTRLR